MYVGEQELSNLNTKYTVIFREYYYFRSDSGVVIIFLKAALFFRDGD